MLFVYQFEFQKGGLSYEVNRSLGVLYAWELYEYSVIILRDNFRFRDTKLVHPVSNCFQTLIKSKFPDIFRILAAHLQENPFSFLNCLR